MRFDKNLKPELGASTEAHRTHIVNPYLDTENKAIIATDGHCMVIAPVEVEEGDVSGYVSEEALKAARKTAKLLHTSTAQIHCNGTLHIDAGPTFPRPGDGCTFLDWKQCVPVTGDCNQITIGIDPTLLLELAKAIGTPNAVHLTITVPTNCDNVVQKDREMDSPIGVNMDSRESGGAWGVIMPVRVK